MKRKTFLAAMGLPVVSTLIPKKEIPGLEKLCKTQRDQEGPFYKANAPQRALIEKDGVPLTIKGRIVQGSDCKTPVAGAIVDIWHCDRHGNYDNEGFRCRGMVTTDQSGRYSFTSIFPPSYGNRPRHIHVKVRAQGFDELTTQIYFKGDKHIQNDFARNADASRVIELVTEGDMRKWQFDIFL